LGRADRVFKENKVGRVGRAEKLELAVAVLVAVEAAAAASATAAAGAVAGGAGEANRLAARIAVRVSRLGTPKCGSASAAQSTSRRTVGTCVGKGGFPERQGVGQIDRETCKQSVWQRSRQITGSMT